ncbi:unnamed protein product, partial [marine sediment metagenome]
SAKSLLRDSSPIGLRMTKNEVTKTISPKNA